MEEFVKGTCNFMCSSQEMHMREKERLLHRLEMVHGTENYKIPKADPNRIVKSFSRSAADMKIAVPHLLRPFGVLHRTVHYLLTEVATTREVSTLSVYHFLWDRLRAVRQDMTVQALPPGQSALLLEPMVRFHALYGYKLCELPPGDYDAVLNKKQLLECLKQLLLCYDEMEVHDQSTSSDDYLAKLCREQLKINETKKLDYDRKLMEALYVVCNLDNIHPLLRYLKLPKKYRCDCVQLSYQLALEVARGNFVRACRLAARLPPLALAVFVVHLPHIQRRAIEVLSHAYSSRQLAYPSRALARCLLFDSSEEACGACAHYGLTTSDGNVLFDKSQYKADARTLQPTKISLVNEEDLLTTDGNFKG